MQKVVATDPAMGEGERVDPALRPGERAASAQSGDWTRSDTDAHEEGATNSSMAQADVEVRARALQVYAVH